MAGMKHAPLPNLAGIILALATVHPSQQWFVASMLIVVLVFCRYLR